MYAVATTSEGGLVVKTYRTDPLLLRSPSGGTSVVQTAKLPDVIVKKCDSRKTPTSDTRLDGWTT